MRVPGIYNFDDADAELSLLPMSARRALDCAGLHLSLRGWQRLSLAQRQTLVKLGAAEVVDPASVAACLSEHTQDVRSEPPLREAPASEGPSAALTEALPAGHSMTAALWAALTALDRYVLLQLARRGKRERLAQAFAEICSRVRPERL